MFKKIGIGLAFAAACSLGVYFFSDITRKDIAAANAFTRLAASEPLSAGDIVVVPKRGQMSRICNAVVTPTDLMGEERSGRYFNLSQKIVAAGVGAAKAIGLMGDARAKTILSRSEVAFVGKTSALSGAKYTYLNPEDCDCAIVRSLARGDRVCNVTASLIETGEVTQVNTDGELSIRPIQRSLAVTLGRHVMYVPPERFAACGVDHTDAAKLVQQQLCTGTSRLPLDVKVRQLLNLVDRETLDFATASIK